MVALIVMLTHTHTHTMLDTLGLLMIALPAIAYASNRVLCVIEGVINLGCANLERC